MSIDTSARHHHTASRVRGGGVSIFAEISARAAELGAVNLGQGAPDFDPPVELRNALSRAIENGHNQYAASPGETPLRDAIAEHAQRFYGQTIDPRAHVTVTSGATEALWCAAFALIDPGDEVIVFEPAYDAYVPAIRMAGGTPVPVTLHAPSFRFDPDELRAAFSKRTRVIYINTPHNPTGTVFNSEELSLIAELCCEHDVVAITDEVYEHIVFDDAVHRRLATFPGMWDRTLTISSAGKTFSCTGWKTGWTIGPEEFQRAVRGVHQWTVFASATPMQHAIAEGLRLPDSYFQELQRDYTMRRDLLLGVLRETRLESYVPEGSYFILAGIDRMPHGDSIEFARYLVEDVGVAVIPIGGFYLSAREGDRLVRFAFCKKRETLIAARDRLLQHRS